MQKIFIPAAVTSLLALFSSGCAAPGQPGSTENTAVNVGGGAVIGCVGGAVIAQLAGGKAAKGCVMGAVVGGVLGYVKARQEEVDAAKATGEEAVATVPGAKAEPVVTENVQVKDKNTGEVRTVQAVKDVTIDMPLSQKGTPEYDNSMARIRALAERYADERQSADLTVAMNSREARQQKFVASTSIVSTASGKGNIRLVRSIDNKVPNGYERITVHARNPAQVET